MLVAMKIANTRLESNLRFGQSVDRVRYDISAVDVQDRIARTDMTVDLLSDDRETLTVDKDKGTLFNLSEKEMVQAGPLNPGSVIGMQVATKLATYVDADVLARVVDAFATFDTGDLTTLVSNGTPITINGTTTPQMATRMPAKLRKNNQSLSNLAFVMDSYAIADTFQFLLGKNADFVNALFQNGYVNEDYASAQVFVSENLMGEAVVNISATVGNGDTITYNGVVFTFVTSIGSTPGNVLIGANPAASRANLIAAINGASGAGTTYVEPTAANRRLISRTYRFTAAEVGTTVRVRGTGSGRITVAETFGEAANEFTKNFIHTYFGKKGAIDVVVQAESKLEMLQEPKQPGSRNIASTIIYGDEVFHDGKQKYLDVHIAS